jgi:hypothetical protein
MSRQEIPRAWRDAAVKSGWIIKLCASGHEKWFPPDRSQKVVVVAASGDWRGLKNSRARLRKAGLNI